ncbi:MAG TPA: flagellar biosynthetic protein FliO [Chloroflexota bacterium]|nr:flagellar biosynthetic protein FliO [Chloroflexota bacterium]
MPDAAPRSKRAVSTARVVAAARPPKQRAPVANRPVVQPAAVVLPDRIPSRQPGFRVLPPTPVVEDDAEEPSTNYALRLTEALEAISSAQNPTFAGTGAQRDMEKIGPAPYGATPPGSSLGPRGAAAAQRGPQGTANDGRGAAGAQRQGRDARGSRTSERSEAGPARGRTEPRRSAFLRLTEGFGRLPPIRLPFGPAIPWRFGLPGLVLIVVVMVFAARPTSPPAPMPTPEPYAVQQSAPLFTDAQPTAAPAPPLGVPDPGGPGFDVLDLGLKLIAVLALAYGSLLLLKRAGLGGTAGIKLGGKSAGLQVVASLTLAPNRTVHLLKVPGGKTLLVGATPNQVNLIVDLGDVAEDPDAETTGSFFDILKGKLPQ